MEAMEQAQRYFAAWNARDPKGVVATFASGGTYEDPATGGPLTGDAIGTMVQELIDAIPDLSFDIVSAAPAGEGAVAAQWLMKGTNSGSFAGLPPSGAKVALRGADFITIESGGIRSVRGYFDRQQFSEQLGLQVMTQPHEIGPFHFGNGVHVDLGKRTKPGAFSLTSIAVRPDEEAELTERAQRVLIETTQMPGFISAFTGGVPGRGFTTTAWENVDAPRQLLAGGAHGDAMRRFFDGGFALGGITSVWVPERINTMWVRCTTCGSMESADRPEGRCSCGATLPEHPPYW